MNPLRAELGLPPSRRSTTSTSPPSVVLAYTAEPFEYPRSDWPAKLTLVGPGLWEPPADPPAWLDELEQPLVLVTCSTLFQNDRRLAEVAVRGARRRAVRGRRHDRRRRPGRSAGGGERTRRALPAARAAARARRLRRLPRRHGDHPEGARPRRARRRCSLRARPAGGRPPRRGRRRRRAASRTQAHAGAAPGGGAPRDRAAGRAPSGSLPPSLPPEAPRPPRMCSKNSSQRGFEGLRCAGQPSLIGS